MFKFSKVFKQSFPVLMKTATKNYSSKRKITAVLYEAGEAAKNPKLLGCKENALGLRDYFESKGFEFVSISDKEKELDEHLKDTEILISTPFHPAYLTKERIENAPKLKLSVTAGIGSDHIDLLAASKNGIIVTEVTGSNVVSVSEHVVMQILALVRNYIPAYHQVINGEWNVAKIAERSYDLEGKVVGTVGCGRIGQRVIQRLKPFDCKELLYYDYAQLHPEVEKEMGLRFVSTVEELVKQCDIVTINCPLHKDTEHLFNKEMLSKMKKGSYLVNTSRGKIVQAEDLAESLKSGHLAGYAGDVWYPQPAPKDHVWRTMPNHAMTPHCSGTTLDAQARYAAGVKDIITRYFEGRDFTLEDVIVFPDGKLAPQYDKSYKHGKQGKLSKGGSYNLVNK